MTYKITIQLEDESGPVFTLQSPQAIFQEDGVWTAVDNECGNGNVERFSSLENACRFLEHDLPVDFKEV